MEAFGGERVGVVEEGGLRLDKALVGLFPDLSRARLQDLVREGHVSRDGAILRDPSAKIAAGSCLTLDVPPPADPVPAAETISLVIAYEDDDLVVVDKPAGLVVHPAPGHEGGTLVNALIAHCGESLSGVGGVRRPGIVHRLDKDTSGLIVVAKNDAAHRGLADQFADHGRSGPLERAYLAFVWGKPQPVVGTIQASLARSRHNREKIAVVPEEAGRHAITHYAVEESYPEAKLVPDARLALDALGRQALHATLLGFAHPRSGETLRFESPLPPELASLRAALLA